MKFKPAILPYCAPRIPATSRVNLSLSAVRYLIPALMTALLILSGCGFTSSSQSSSAQLQRAASLTLVSSSGDTFVYQIADPELQPSIFLTVIDECGTSRRELKPSLSRQLFVGFEDLRVVKSQQLNGPSGPALETLVQAAVEETPVSIVSYLTIGSRCSRDVVFWSEHSNPKDLRDLLQTHQTAQNILTRGAP